MPDYYLFLDDYRFPNQVFWVDLPADKDWVIVRRYYDFVKYIQENGSPSFCSLDHDLDRHNMPVESLPDPENDGVNLGNGLDCVKWLGDYCTKTGAAFPEYVVHSTNPKAGPRMVEWIKEYKAGVTNG